MDIGCCNDEGQNATVVTIGGQLVNRFLDMHMYPTAKEFVR